MEQTADQIGHAISMAAEAVTKLHDKGLINVSNIDKANEVLGQLIDKASDSIKSMGGSIKEDNEDVGKSK